MQALQEMAELREHITELKAEHTHVIDECVALIKERDVADAEVKRLRKANEAWHQRIKNAKLCKDANRRALVEQAFDAGVALGADTHDLRDTEAVKKEYLDALLEGK